MTTTPFSLKVRHYKCFGEAFAGFDTIKPINVLIGRNNSGKSALLDIVAAMCTANPILRQEDSPRGTSVQIECSALISEREARRAFNQNTSGGEILTSDHWRAGEQYVGHTITWVQPGNSHEARSFVSTSFNGKHLYRSERGKAQAEQNLTNVMTNPLREKQFRRLAAERNVVPEPDSADTARVEPQPNGANITNLIQRFYNSASLDRAVVEELLLDELNAIVAPDYRFNEIVLRRLDNTGYWEIFLRESDKGLVALSASGSGLKTIFCVLAFVVLWPTFSHKTALSSYVFGFEELENNLHPALLRRLLLYIAKRIKEEESAVFLTTHSSAAIDLFAVSTPLTPSPETNAGTATARTKVTPR